MGDIPLRSLFHRLDYLSSLKNCSVASATNRETVDVSSLLSLLDFVLVTSRCRDSC